MYISRNQEIILFYTHKVFHIVECSFTRIALCDLLLRIIVTNQVTSLAVAPALVSIDVMGLQGLKLVIYQRSCHVDSLGQSLLFGIIDLGTL